MKTLSTISVPMAPEDERKNLNVELWHACAGPLVFLPPDGSHVVYFPQGHSEQLAASTNKEVDGQIPNYPNLPPQLICQLDSAILRADNETDEVYAQMTLQPLSVQERERLLISDQDIPSRQPSNLFCKTLTASDTSSHGGFSIPRRAAEKVFPPLDFTQQPPTQQLIARDLHGIEWKFRHIYRGQPKRHLLTTGWSVFVSAKRLTAGDSVLFIRNDSEQLLLGIKRASRSQTIMPSSVLSSDSMHIGVLAAAAHAAATNSKFTVFYNPRTSPSDFVVPLSKYAKAVYYSRVSVGMRFRMLFETEESSTRKYMGTITGIGELDAVRWPNSHWRTVKVGWDECTTGAQQKRVSLWEIEPLTTFLLYPPSSNWKLKRPWSEAFYSTSNHGDNIMENVEKSFMLMKDDKGCQGSANPTTGANTLAPMQQTHEANVLSLQSNIYNVMAAAALQEIRGTPKQFSGFQLQPFQSQQLENKGIPSKQLLGVQQQHIQSQQVSSSQLQQKQECLSLQQQLPKVSLQPFLQQTPWLSQKTKQDFDQEKSQQPPTHPQLPLHVNEEHLQRLLASELQQQQTLQLPSIFGTITSLQPPVSTLPVQMQPHISTIALEMQPHGSTISSMQSRVSSVPMQMHCSSTSEPNPILTSTIYQKPLAVQTVLSNFTSDNNLLQSTLLPSVTNTHKQHTDLIPSSDFHQDSVSASWFSSVHSSNDSNSSVESVEDPCPTGGKCNLSMKDMSVTSSLSNPPLLQKCFREPLQNTQSMEGISSFCMTDSSLVDIIPAPSLPLISIRDCSQKHDSIHSDSRLLSGVQKNALPLVPPKPIANASNGTASAAELQNHLLNNMLQGQNTMGPRMLCPGSVINECMDKELSLQQDQSLGQGNPSTRTYTKVYKYGSVGRSLDVNRFRSYAELRHELACMFHLEGQIEDPERSTWQLVFIDKENDILLLGDDPWEEFVKNVRCIKILSPPEVLQMAQERMGLLSSLTTQWQSSSGSNAHSAITAAYSLDH